MMRGEDERKRKRGSVGGKERKGKERKGKERKGKERGRVVERRRKWKQGDCRNKGKERKEEEWWSVGRRGSKGV